MKNYWVLEKNCAMMTYSLIVARRRQGVTDVTCEFMAHPGYPTKLTPEKQHDALLIGDMASFSRKSYHARLDTRAFDVSSFHVFCHDRILGLMINGVANGVSS